MYVNNEITLKTLRKHVFRPLLFRLQVYEKLLSYLIPNYEIELCWVVSVLLATKLRMNRPDLVYLWKKQQKRRNRNQASCLVLLRKSLIHSPIMYGYIERTKRLQEAYKQCSGRFGRLISR